jgi:hypothetical protein
MKTNEGKIIHFGLPEELHQRARIQTMKMRGTDGKNITLQALVIKALEEYLDRIEGQDKSPELYSANVENDVKPTFSKDMKF